jgi:iron complex outermembrane receptor protein
MYNQDNMGLGHRRRKALLVAPAVLTALATNAFADQSADSSYGQLEEVVVTALKRPQPLQETPISVTAFTAEQLQQQNITRPMDFIGATPNITAVEANNAGDLRITIRGDAQALNTDPPVAVVVDGVVLTGATGLNKDFLDIQQIEVLKGPQGYLYGRDAIAGAINITTRAPTDTFEGEALAGYGNGDSSRAQLRLSGPLVAGVLRASLAVNTRNTDGFYSNITTGDKVDPYHEDSARLRLDWLPTDDLRAQLSLFDSRIHASATNYTSQSLLPSLQTAGAISGIVNANFTGAPFVFSVGNFNDKEDRLFSLRLDQTTRAGQLTSITAYESEDNVFASAAYPYLADSNAYQYNQKQHKSLSEELRFTSPTENAFRYIGGLYYTHIAEEPFLLAATGTSVSGSPPNFTQPINNASGNTTETFSADSTYADAYAAFLNLNYSITSALELTLAGRYDHENKHAQDVAPAEFSATSGVTRYAVYQKFQPKVGLQWKFSPDINAYATYSEGFKAGGFNAAQAFTITGGAAPNQYPEERAKNTEIGLKSQWLDRRLVVNAAAFYTRKDNSQLFQFIPAGSLNAVTVIDQIKVKGGELEIVALPATAFAIHAGVGYTNAKIDRLASNPTYVGNWAPYVPNITASVTPSYTWRLGNDRNVVLDATYEHWGKTYFDTANSPQATRDPLNFINSRLSTNFGSWSFGLWGRNLTNKTYNSDVIVILNQPGSFTQAVYKAPPRTYGADVSVKW